MQAESEVESSPAAPSAHGAAATIGHAEPDWLDRICPYLLSEDGTYRSSQPDAGHRCTAQDPPSPLPTAFQERFCLTERHVRCEMFKVAQSARAAALDQGGIPASQLQSARFKPSVRSVPLALGPSSGAQGSGSIGTRRPVILAALSIGMVAVFIFLLVFMLGGPGDPGAGPGASPSPSPRQTVVHTPTPRISPAPTLASTPEPGASLTASQAPAVDATMIEYQVQEAEALLHIAEVFGVSRRQIILANEGMADKKPYTLPGDIIIVPVAPDLPPEQLAAIEALPGFVGYVE